MSEPTPRALPSDSIRAVVHAAGVATPYLRTGRGAPVVLVAGQEWTRLLLPLLAGGRSVLAPEVPALPTSATDPSGRVAFCRWLRAVFEGLGLERPALVAAGGAVTAALAFALLEEDRLERLVLLAAAAEEADDRELDGRLGCPSLRLRAVAGGAEARVAAEAAVRFLAGGD
ncbi:MAG TPA: hypothetical protein VHM02_14655 [Thermoanaerobaculia bacterium]|nr:hypothetical protein [Thermoanaerobaculia bacterium]